MDIRQNHWNTIAGTGGNGRSCLEKFINSNHRRNVSQRKDFERFRHRERFSCFFLSIRSGNPKRNNSSKNRANRIFVRVPFETLETFRMDFGTVPRTHRVRSIFLFYSSSIRPRIPAENRGTAVIVGHSKVSRFVLPIVGKRETRSSRGNAADPHCEIVSNVADLFLLRERRRICSREEESSIAFPQCS